jgi:linoleoyl-CoA desaturase
MTVSQPAPTTRSDGRSFPRTTSGGLKFAPNDGFHDALRHRVDRYFESTGRRPRDCPRMYLKTAIILGWLAASYTLLLLAAGTWWLALPLTMSLGLAMAACGFNIQHDGGHQAYSKRKWVNKLAALTLDLLGGSSYVWDRKHNIIHHSFSNVTGHDNDVNIGFFGRISPHQKRLGFHRWQHVYLWFLYGFLPIKWQLYDDFRDVLAGRIEGRRFARPRGWDLATFLGGKAVFFSLAFGIPLLLYPLWVVLLCYLATSFVQGLALSIVFQLAHCVEEADFPLPREDTGRLENSWAVHQVETTVDFAPRNRLLFWFIGGLNFQIEHHLFPRVSHVHYPALAPIVEDTCREYGLTYVAHPTFRAGVASHFHWLRQMGRPGVAPAEHDRKRIEEPAMQPRSESNRVPGSSTNSRR